MVRLLIRESWVRIPPGPPQMRIPPSGADYVYSHPVNMVASQVKEKHRLFSPMDNMSLRGERSGKKPVRDGSKLWRVR